MDDEPIYWSGEPEGIRIAKTPPQSSAFIRVYPNRMGAQIVWGVLIAALAGIILLNWLPPYQQSNIRLIIRAVRSSIESSFEHPRIIPPLIMAVGFDTVGLYDRAITSYGTILAIDPSFEWGYYGRGAAHRAIGAPDKAISDLSTAIMLNPEMVWAYNMRGLVSRDMIRDYDAARLDFQEAVRIDPDFAWGHVNLARLHPDAEIALTHFEIAIDLGLGNRPEVYVHRANSYTRLQRYDEALADFDHAQTLDPDFEWVYFYRPRALEPLGAVDSAINDYRRFLELYPNRDENSAFARSELLRLGVPESELE